MWLCGWGDWLGENRPAESLSRYLVCRAGVGVCSTGHRIYSARWAFQFKDAGSAQYAVCSIRGAAAAVAAVAAASRPRYAAARGDSAFGFELAFEVDLALDFEVGAYVVCDGGDDEDEDYGEGHGGLVVEVPEVMVCGGVC